MAEVSDNFARTASFKLPKVKESFPLIQTKSMSYGNLASALINPTTRLSIAHTQNRDEFSPSARGSPRLPTISEIQGYSDGFLSSKKRCLETSPNPPPVSSQRVIKLPRVKLAQAKRGIHTGPSWNGEESDLDLFEGTKITRYSSRPEKLSQSWKTIFPTKDLPYNVIPETSSQRFSLIDPQVDIELANYVVNSTNAFKTEWSKKNELKDRKFFPELHPEFLGISKEQYRKRDKVVNYREAMLKVKAMMGAAWGNKK